MTHKHLPPSHTVALVPELTIASILCSCQQEGSKYRKDMPFEEYAKAVGINKKVLRTRMNGSVDMAASTGPKPLLNLEKQQVVVDTLRRMDRSNNGQSVAKGASLVQELKPGLHRKQAVNVLATIRRQHKDVLTGPVKVQQSTSKRTEVTVAMQSIWHKTVDSVRTDLRTWNTGMNDSGKTFVDDENHFWVFLDETCLMANQGEVIILGDKEKKKHEKNVNDSRESITMVRVGSTESAGPTAFLLAGKKKREGFTDSFLERNGAEKGSTIIMTPTAFMTDEAWIELAKALAKAIRDMPIIKDHPDWWVCLVLDGYGSHVKNLIANQIFHDNKILILKELADMSHVDQVYDQEVAVCDKRGMRECLPLMRTRVGEMKGVIDQWALVHAGLYALRNTGVDVWVKSARGVNLLMSERKTFAEWIPTKSHFIQSGMNFKREVSVTSPEYVYSLAPVWWHGTTPDEKALIMAIVDRHGGSFSVACVKALHSEAHIPLSDMQDLRACREMAIEHPTHLQMGAPTTAPEAPQLQEESLFLPVTHGLATFELKPAALVKQAKEEKDPMPLLNHMVTFNRRMNGKVGKGGRPFLVPSPLVGDIEIHPDQHSILNPSADDMTVQYIMRTAGGEGATRKMAKRKLSALGGINSLCCVVNGRKELEQQKRQLELAASLAEISAHKTAVAKKKRTK